MIEILHVITQQTFLHGCLACTTGTNSVPSYIGLAGGTGGMLGGLSALAPGSGADDGISSGTGNDADDPGLDGGLAPGGTSGGADDEPVFADADAPGDAAIMSGDPDLSTLADGGVPTPDAPDAPGTPDAAPDGEAPKDSGPDAFPPPLPPASSAQVNAWIGEATAVLLDSGSYTPAQLNASDIALIIQYESSNIPNIVNTWDINAQNGIPSQGLMQVTPPTFNQWALPGYNDNIMDPVQNIIAGVRYAIARYGSLGNVPGVVQVQNGGSYVGY
jgi:hypothetical protein